MITVTANISGTGGLLNLVKVAQAAITERLEYHGNRMLDEQLANNPDRKHLIEVDNRRATRADFATAKKRIVVRFVEELLNLAVGQFKKILSENIQASGPDADARQWIDVDATAALNNILMFYGEKGGALAPISGASDISDFKPGDFIILVPAYPIQMYANATKYGASGFMAKAAARIRHKLIGTRSARIQGKKSTITVRAERSRAAFAYLAAGPRPTRPRDGREIDLTVPRPGMDSAWVITIRYREDRNGK